MSAPVKLTKAMRAALEDLATSPYVVSTADAFSRLVREGLATSEGLRVSSRGRSGCTLKSSYAITAAGRAALEGSKS